MALYDEYARHISTLFAIEEKEAVGSPVSLDGTSGRETSMRTTDSGIESLDQNSVASSAVSKSKSLKNWRERKHYRGKLILYENW